MSFDGFVSKGGDENLQFFGFVFFCSVDGMVTA